jgi:hypothetical protein
VVNDLGTSIFVRGVDFLSAFDKPERDSLAGDQGCKVAAPPRSVNDNNCLGVARRATNRTESVLLSHYLREPFVTFDAVGASNSP